MGERLFPGAFRSGLSGLGFLVWSVAAACGPARAAEPAAPAPAKAESATGAATSETGQGVDLDRLLKLPSSGDYGMEKRGGATRAEWRSRFREARGDVDKSKKKLGTLQDKLDQAASESDSPWRFVPPGASAAPSDNTENFSLTEAIRREKSELQRAEKRLRDLDVEANLAGVPADWRE
ncbi:MAG TPA: hypothetical protein VMW35_02435 [Myxococcota bacterium]|jgi:hypothetical protein|nr:hypothetical protein [Myxococcota bacterium]